MANMAGGKAEKH